MQRFETGDLYRPSAQGQGFAPIQAPDITPLLRENNRARLEEAKNFADARLADLRMEEQALKYQGLLEEETVQNLAQFSTTLSEAVVGFAQKRNEAEEQRGIMLAYTNGVDPMATAQFDLEEAALEEGTASVNEIAGQFRSEGMPVEMVEQVQNLSGWAKYGYMKGLAQQGGAAYGEFYTQAASELMLNVPGRDQPINLLQAETSAERAYIKTVIAQQYLEQYRGMNPLLLNKYLFPNMKQWENSDDLAFAKKQRDQFEEGQKETFKNEVFNSTQDVNSFGDSMMAVLKRHKGTWGTTAVAKTKLFEYLVELAKDGVITDDHVKAFEETEFISFATGKPTQAKKEFKRFFKEHNLRKAIIEGNKTRLDLMKTEEANNKEEFLQEARRAKDAAGGDGSYPHALEVELVKRFKLQFPDLEVPDELTSSLSARDRSIEDERKQFLAMAMTQGMTVDESQLDNLAPENKFFFQQKKSGVTIAASDSFMVLDQSQMQRLNQRARRAAQNRYKTSGEDGQYGTEFDDYVDNYKRTFMNEYRKAAQSTPDRDSAYAQAAKLTDALGTYKDNPDGTPGGSDLDGLVDPDEKRVRQNTLETAIRSMEGDNTAYATRKLAGLDDDIKALKQWKQSGGKGPVPRIWQLLANGRDFSAWDVARAQYALYNEGEELTGPTYLETIKEKTPQVQRLLDSYPSLARTARASILEGNGNFNDSRYLYAQGQTTDERASAALDVLGKYESRGRGDYNAVNQIGVAEGRQTLGYSGDIRKMSQHKGKALIDFTLGDIMKLQSESTMSNDEWIASGRLHAVGRYQFIGPTFKMIVEKMGLNVNTKFSPDVQDRMALWLLKNGGGGITQWVGPNDYATPEERALVQQFSY